MKFWLPLFSCLLCMSMVHAQECQLTIKGEIHDEHTEDGLEYANIFIPSLEKGAVSDTNGNFIFQNICPGSYHFRISHIGCETEERFLTIRSDTSIVFHLHHHTELLDEVVLHGESVDQATQSNSSILSSDIRSSSNESLAKITSRIAGVTSLNNGGNISKPIIHGLFGNRISILNNGIAQSGQQWGNDHAPEIDPFSANRITVVKGTLALAYGGSSLGGVVLVEPGPLSDDPHLHGLVGYHLESNGWGHTLNGQLSGMVQKIKWRAKGTFKKKGDSRSADYFLRNTGVEEKNGSIQLIAAFNPQTKTELYLSTFNTSLGILRGAHVGNLTDLEAAIGRDVPFFTQENFSYQIEAPRQNVGHHLLKLNHKYFVDATTTVNLTYGLQLNDRKEFDVRRSGRSDIPALSLKQWNHFLDATYAKDFNGSSFLKTGLLGNITDNTNNPETGIFPLIPDYLEYKASLFSIYQWQEAKWLFEAGARYDFQQLNVVTFDRLPDLQVVRYNRSFHNIHGSIGVSYKPSRLLQMKANIGYAQRPPAVNELYSMGLHQGVSGIEEGDRTLKQENSLKFSLNVDLNIENKLFVQIIGYSQLIQSYIFLQPQDSIRLTIRGAFPTFKYDQTDARLSGVDIVFSYEPNDGIIWRNKVSYIKGWDRSNDQPLVFIPPFSIHSGLDFRLKDFGKFSQTEIGLNAQFVASQNNLVEGQDFLAPPEGYLLFGASVSSHVQIDDHDLKIALSSDNITNRKYRNYLNRLRYFADDLGRNIKLSLQYKF